MTTVLLMLLAQIALPSTEALAACSGRDEGAQCNVTLTDGEHQGVCLKSQREQTSSCMPKPVPPPPAAAAPVTSS